VKERRSRSPGRGPRKPKAVSYETARRFALALPGVEEGTCYGTPACRVGGHILMRLKEDGDSLAILMSFEERSIRLEADPKVFYLTDHYLNYPMVLVRLPAVGAEVLREVVHQAWRRRAPKRLLDAYDAGRPTPPAVPPKAPRRRRPPAPRRP